MSFKVHRFDEPGAQPIHHKFLIVGDSGAGKTIAACRAEADLDLDLDEVWAGSAKPVGDPEMFYLGFERNSLTAARLINPRIGFQLAELVPEEPEAGLEGVPDPAHALKIATEVIRAAASGELARMGFKRIVVDGITELQRLMKDDIVDGLIGDAANEEWRENWFSQDDWNFLKEKTRRAANWIRAISSIDVVVTALEDTFESRRAGATQASDKVGPKMEGRDGAALLQYFEAAGRMERIVVPLAAGRERVEHRVMFTGPSRYKIKPCGPITGWQKPCAAAWGAVLEGRLPPDRTRIRDSMTVADPESDRRPSVDPKAGEVGGEPTKKATRSARKSSAA